MESKKRNYSKEVEIIQKRSLFQDKYHTLYTNENEYTRVIKNHYYGN